jgi:predicted nuclease of predicted toxin-antitoxin system
MTALHFIVDENLPPHLAYWLRDKGHTATHVCYEAMESTPDSDIWAWATARNAIVVSKDEDFHNRVKFGVPPRLLWIRWGNSRKKQLISKLDALWPSIVEAFAEEEWLVELTDASF